MTLTKERAFRFIIDAAAMDKDIDLLVAAIQKSTNDFIKLGTINHMRKEHTNNDEYLPSFINVPVRAAVFNTKLDEPAVILLFYGELDIVTDLPDEQINSVREMAIKAIKTRRQKGTSNEPA